MNSITTRAASYTCSDNSKSVKDVEFVDPINGLDLTLGHLETETISEGTSNSSIVEMNNNTNGNMLSNEYGDTNGNRQKSMSDVAFPPNAMKKIKQIYMEGIPMNMAGLTLSGSGMELYVKRAEHKLKNVNNVQNVHQAKETSNKSVGAKKRRNVNRRNARLAMNRDNARKNLPPRFGDNLPIVEGNRQPTIDQQIEQIQRPVHAQDKPTQQSATQRPEDTRVQNKPPMKNSRLQQLKPLLAHAQHMSYNNPYGFQQHFQQHTPPPHNLTAPINGPSWHVSNGNIDIMHAHESRPSTSNMAEVYDRNPMDYGVNTYPVNPFQGGFKSQNLPLKRRQSPHKFYNLHPIPEEEGNDYDDCYEDIYVNNSGQKRKGRSVERPHNTNSGERSKKLTTEVGKKSRTTKEIVEKETQNKDKDKPKQVSSDISVVESPSVGPQFETTLLQPGKMDAETMLKFTEYTQAVRKDLKQQYKDISKLVKRFEATVQERSKSDDAQDDQSDADSLGSKQNGQCSIM